MNREEGMEVTPRTSTSSRRAMKLFRNGCKRQTPLPEKENRKPSLLSSSANVVDAMEKRTVWRPVPKPAEAAGLEYQKHHLEDAAFKANVYPRHESHKPNKRRPQLEDEVHEILRDASRCGDQHEIHVMPLKEMPAKGDDGGREMPTDAHEMLTASQRHGHEMPTGAQRGHYQGHEMPADAHHEMPADARRGRHYSNNQRLGHGVSHHHKGHYCTRDHQVQGPRDQAHGTRDNQFHGTLDNHRQDHQVHHDTGASQGDNHHRAWDNHLPPRENHDQVHRDTPVNHGDSDWRVHHDARVNHGDSDWRVHHDARVNHGDNYQQAWNNHRPGNNHHQVHHDTPVNHGDSHWPGYRVHDARVNHEVKHQQARGNYHPPGDNHHQVHHDTWGKHQEVRDTWDNHGRDHASKKGPRKCLYNAGFDRRKITEDGHGGRSEDAGGDRQRPETKRNEDGMALIGKFGARWDAASTNIEDGNHGKASSSHPRIEEHTTVTDTSHPLAVSCISRLQSEIYHRSKGTYLLEVEKVLEAVCPSLPSPNGCFFGSWFRHARLKAIWEWYERPSCFGAEVRSCWDSISGAYSDAYFVPYLSAIQLFQEGRKVPVYEYIERVGEPHNRLPFLQNIRKLAEETSIIEEAMINDLHPSSWFAVAWYPIYRVPEGHLDMAFLTYHSLGHITQTHSLPVVGLQAYLRGPIWPSKAQEGWFKTDLPTTTTEGSLARDRLRSLDAAARYLSTFSGSKHSDYTFFMERGIKLEVL